MKANEAEELVKIEIEKDSDLFIVMPQHTFESNKCYAVFYQTKKYVETKNTDYMAIGHGAILVDKETRKLFHTGSGRIVTSYIDSYEKYGDPHLQENKHFLKVVYQPTKSGNNLNAIRLVKMLTNLGITESKENLENMKKGNEITVKNHDLSDLLKEELKTNGFVLSYLIE